MIPTREDTCFGLYPGVRFRAKRLQMDPKQTVRRVALDRCVWIFLCGQRFSKKIEKKPKRMGIEVPKLRESDRGAICEFRAGGFKLAMFLGDVARQEFTLLISLSYPSHGPSWSSFTVFAQSRMNTYRWRCRPWRAGGQIFGLDRNRQMSRRIERETGSGQSMGLRVVLACGEPYCERAEVGRPVTSPGPSLID